jgi:chromate transporter
MSDEVYAELFALGQCMPGPTSTQVSFAIGIIKKGVSGKPSAATTLSLQMPALLGISMSGALPLIRGMFGAS